MVQRPRKEALLHGKENYATWSMDTLMKLRGDEPLFTDDLPVNRGFLLPPSLNLTSFDGMPALSCDSDKGTTKIYTQPHRFQS